MGDTTRLDVTVYRTAERLLQHNRSALVLGDKVRPRWIGARFRYVVKTPSGTRFVLVDPAAGTREPAFDHDRLATSLSKASGHEVEAAALPFAAIEPKDGMGRVLHLTARLGRPLDRRETGKRRSCRQSMTWAAGWPTKENWATRFSLMSSACQVCIAESALRQ
ncbi:hypothetical protein [Nonomuraea roseola]|uniref:Uncharacterized protein n=1 Tax=Nonomuraea roseola TaxID=46179 RepID=A0ABV5PWK3_9ACTN